MKIFISTSFAIVLTTLLIQAAFAGGSSSGGGRDYAGGGRSFYDYRESENCSEVVTSPSNDRSIESASVTCENTMGCSKEEMARLCEK